MKKSPAGETGLRGYGKSDRFAVLWKTEMSRIMLVDDEQPVRKYLSVVLEANGYDVFTATDGNDALAQLEETRVDLIVADMNMPVMDGLQFLEKLASERISRAPVLMMSGSAGLQEKVRCYQLGVYDFIDKPEENAVFLKRIENGLKIGEMMKFNDNIRVELQISRKLQKYLFPEPVMSDKGVGFSVYFRQLFDIGGDLYDYIYLRNGKVIFIVADVSGHSISAALYTAIVKMVFRNALRDEETPAGILSIMNRELSATLPVELFVTMFCGIIDPETGMLSYSNAGHPKPYLASAGRVTEIPGNDSFLGPIKGASYRDFSIRLKAGDSLMVYTDGLTDSIKNCGADLSVEKIAGVLRDNSGAAILDGVGKLFSDYQMDFMDDCTMMFISYSGHHSL